MIDQSHFNHFDRRQTTDIFCKGNEQVTKSVNALKPILPSSNVLTLKDADAAMRSGFIPCVLLCYARASHGTPFFSSARCHGCVLMQPAALEKISAHRMHEHLQVHAHPSPAFF